MGIRPQLPRRRSARPPGVEQHHQVVEADPTIAGAVHVHGTRLDRHIDALDNVSKFLAMEPAEGRRVRWGAALKMDARPSSLVRMSPVRMVQRLFPRQ